MMTNREQVMYMAAEIQHGRQPNVHPTVKIYTHTHTSKTLVVHDTIL